MQASQSRSKPTYTPLQKQLMYRCLPIGVTAVLILCLEGWPPTAWIQLTRVCVQWSSLWSHQQAALLLPAFWLLLQSLLLLAAWVLWSRLAYGEIMALVALSQSSKPQPGLPGQGQSYYSGARQPVANRQQLPAAPLHSPPPVTSPEQYRQQATPAQAVQSGAWIQQERQPPPPTPTPINQDYNQGAGSLLTYNPTPRQSPQPNLKLVNPFEEEVETEAPTFTPEERPEQAATIEEAEGAEEEVEAPLPPPDTSIIENPFEEQEDTNKHQRIARAARRKRESQPANEQEQTAILQDLGFLRSEAGAEKSGSEDTAEQTTVRHDLAEIEAIAPTRAQPSAVANPFDVQSDLIDLFQESSTIEEQDENLDTDEESDPEQLYVFGNPFEGPLPDVFQHDQDLQRVVRELRSPEEQKGGQKKKEN